jgi:hypothetical protein
VAQTTLGRCVLLAALLHLLLVLWVGTPAGSGGGGGSLGAPVLGPLDIRLRLESPAAPPTVSAATARPAAAATTATVSEQPSAVPLAPASPPGPVTAAAQAKARQPLAPSPAVPEPTAQPDRDAAPQQEPVATAQAGQRPEGSLLRGLDSGLPAGPELADLQPPPVDSSAVARLPEWTSAPAPQLPEPTAVIARQADEAAEGRAVVPQPPPGAVRSAELPFPMDALPQRIPALVPAERVALPADTDPTAGVPLARRKLPAAPLAASAPTRSPSAEASALAPDLPLNALAPPPRVTPQARAEAPAASAPLPPPVIVAVPATASPPAAPILRELPPQTRQADTLADVPPVAPLTAPPRLQLPAALPPAPAVRAAELAAPAEPSSASPTEPSRPPARTDPVRAAAAEGVDRAPVKAPVVSEAQAPVRLLPTPGPAGPAATAASPPGRSTGDGGQDAALRGIIAIPAPPAVAASAALAPPRLDLSLPKLPSDARVPPESAARVPLDLRLPPGESRSKFAREVEKSLKEDCRKAHADKGLLAAPALVADALRKESGCKW